MQSTTPNDFTDAIERLRASRANRNRVALVSNRGYIVFSTPGPDKPVHVQVSGGRNLPPNTKLTPQAAGALGEAGLRQKRASGDFQRRILPGRADEVAPLVDRAFSLLTEQLGAEPESIVLRSRFEQVPELDNSQVEEAMNHLAKRRDWPARTGLYRTLVDAQLVCAVDEGASAGESGEWRPYRAGMLGPLPSAAIFTNYEALDHFAPVGLSARVLPGHALFPELLAFGVGSALVNPGGQPRGELYQNEIQILVDGIKKLKGIH